MRRRILSTEARRQTLDRLDPPEWGPANYSSHVVRECHRLRRVVLEHMTPGDLRIQIGQKLSLRWLVPMALDVVEGDPLCFADFYAGDLLKVLLELPESYWDAHLDLEARLVGVLGTIEETPEELTEACLKFKSRQKAP